MHSIARDHQIRNLLSSPVTITFALATAVYFLGPQIIASREAARLTQCRNRIWIGYAGYHAHTIVFDDHFDIVRVDSDPLYPIPLDVNDKYLYGFFRQELAAAEPIRLDLNDVPASAFERAKLRIEELLASKEFLHRQGRTPAP